MALFNQSPSQAFLQKLRRSPTWDRRWDERAAVLAEEMDVADQKIPLAIELQEFFVEECPGETDGVNWLEIAKALLTEAALRKAGR